ncbi:MAG: lamin tail domain-containing protein [Lentisphaerae bacterium]|nr:lamin tail domain-containing protein [Lentisphaerota bacterium]
MKRCLRRIAAVFGLWLAWGVQATAQTGPLHAAERQLSPCTRRTPLVISEIMYHPPPRPDALNLEFVEIFNTEPVSHDLSNFRLSGDVEYRFPTNFTLAARAFMVIASDPTAIQAAYAISNVLGPFTHALPDDAGVVRLRNAQDAILVDVEYADAAPWPLAADGAGHSLWLSQPDYGERDLRAWSASSRTGGSPGTADPGDADPLAGVIINEFLAHTDLPVVDFVELYNPTTQALDVSGCALSDDVGSNRYTFAAGTLLPPGGFLVRMDAELGFALSSHGDEIVLRNPSGSRVLAALRFDAQANGVAMGRYPDGAPAFHPLRLPTPGAANAPRRLPDVGISEIMYAPISGLEADEYVELFNRGTQTVDLTHWRFVAGIDYVFPPGATVAPGAYVVVARDAARLRAHHVPLNAANTFGDYRGQLADRGERLALARPDDPALPYEDFVVVDEVTYSDGWGEWADGGGSSLELTDARSDNDLGSNWAASDETQKAPWTTVTFTGRIDNGLGSIGELQVIGLQAGEFLLDNVELVLEGDTVNRVYNPDFESGLTGWYRRGNHVRSELRTTEGYASANSLHVRASARGDITMTGSAWTFQDQVATFLSPLPAANERFTLRAKVRWLCGYPHALLALQGFWLEAAGRMELPPNLGTPGQVNSRRVVNASPAISEVHHHPLLPAAGQPVTVDAHLDDPDGIAAAWLTYRLDPSTSVVTLPMIHAGSGRYVATIPGQSSGALVAFTIGATDGHAAAASGEFPPAAGREALVRVGEPAAFGLFGGYRLWLTAANQTLWNSRLTHDNEPIDFTLIVEGARAIYNSGGHYRGGWRTYDGPAGSRMCAYNLEVPKSERVLGDNEIKLDMTGHANEDSTRQAERFSFWLARQLGRSYSNLRYVNVRVNGVLRQPLHDYQVPSQDFVESWCPGEDDPPIFKQETEQALTLMVSDGGAYKQSRYRDVWRPRKPKTPTDDLKDVYARVEAFNLPFGEAYRARTAALADLDSWLGYFVVNHLLENIDSWGYDLHHNAFVYLSRIRPGPAFLQDTDFSMYTRYTTAAHHDPFFNDDPVTARLFNHPPFRRAYWRLLKEAVNGPMLPARCHPVLDELDAAMTANGLAHTSPATVKAWLANRRAYLLPLIATVEAPFAITSNDGLDFTVDAPRATLAGTAPVDIAEIRINGARFALEFPSVTNWATTVPLQPGANALNVEGFDRFGQLLATDTITATATVAPPDPAGWIVISEIMYHAPGEHADYVEIVNRSTTETFDLSGARFSGIEFTFPPGSFIRPGEARVVADNVTTYTLIYTNAEVVVGAYGGELDNDGEPLLLQMPGATSNTWIDLDVVHYDDDPPWPAEADGHGQSLQVIDPDQDNDRPGNWGVAAPAPAPAWRLRSLTGTVTNASPLVLAGAKLSLHLQAAGAVCVDRLMLVTGTVAGAGANLLANGDFEAGMSGSWSALGNHSGTFITATNPYAGGGALCLVAASPGSAPTHAVVQARPLGGLGGTPVTLSYAYLETESPATLVIGLTASSLADAHSVARIPTNEAAGVTPGATNNVAAPLPPFPRLWMTEIMVSNRTTTVDNRGDYDPWLELLNAETNALDLGGYFLSNDYGDLTRWAFPTGVVIGVGERLLVWLDGEPGESAPGSPHTSFAIDRVSGSVALARGEAERAVLVDFLNYGPLEPDTSYGSYPDGDRFGRQVFHDPSPGQANSPTSSPITVAINEWLADNTRTLADPADGRFQDWFELHNPASDRVHLGGYRLADGMDVTNAFVIPGGTWIEPRGFLLLWADGQAEQNEPGRDLHVSFSLSKGGEALALYAPDGTLVDAVTFGAQESDRTQGRWPDGVGPMRPLSWATPAASNAVLVIQEVSSAADVFMLAWPARPGAAYRVEHRAALTDGTWRAVAIVTATVSEATYHDTNAAAEPLRFYRLTELP